MSANEHIDDLLSGFLDGELTAGEMRELQVAMAADARLGLKVEQLRQLGSELRSLPQRKLPANFAARVLAVAQVEASHLPATQRPSIEPKSVTSGSESTYVVPTRQSAPARAWRTAAISLAAAAASLLFVAYFSGWIASGGRSGGTDQLAKQLSSDRRVAEDPQFGEIQTEKQLEIDSNVVGGETLVGNERPKPSVSQMGLEILTVLEIQPSKEARSLNLIASVLKQAGIDWSTAVSASSDVVEVLNATRSINPGVGSGNDDQVALVLVRAPSVNVDRAMNIFWERDKDFPFVLMDMAFDIPGKDLVRKLLEAQKPVVGGSQSLATPIVLSNVAVKSLEDAAQFSSAPLSRYVTSNERSKPIAAGLELGAPVTANEEQAPTHLLLVIRKPAE